MAQNLHKMILGVNHKDQKIYAVTQPHLALVVMTYHDHIHPIKTNTCKAGKS